MSPEGFPDSVIDKAKQIWNGVRLYWESMLAEERKPVAPIAIEPLHAVAGGDCPSCHTANSIREICPGTRTLRCCQCGWQPEKRQAPGIARSQLEMFECLDARDRSKFNQAFAEALWRIRGPQR
jgi:hypothetical protein